MKVRQAFNIVSRPGRSDTVMSGSTSGREEGPDSNASANHGRVSSSSRPKIEEVHEGEDHYGVRQVGEIHYITSKGIIQDISELKRLSVDALKKYTVTRELASRWNDTEEGDREFIAAFNASIKIQERWRARKLGLAARAKYREMYKNRFAVRDMFFYFFFLSLVGVVIILRAPSQHAFYLHKNLEDLIVEEEFRASDSHIYKSFNDVATEEELWQFLQGPLVGNLFPDDCYGAKDLTQACTGQAYRTVDLVGGVRLRQVRGEKMNDAACLLGIPKYLQPAKGTSCYDSYSDWYSRKTGMGVFLSFFATPDELGTLPKTGDIPIKNAALVANLSLSSCFKYGYNAPATGAIHISSDEIGFYPSGIGYSCDLLVKEGWKAPAILQALKDNEWFDDSTRVLFAEMTFFYPSEGMLVATKLMLEFVPTGGIIATSSFDSATLTTRLPLWKYYTIQGAQILVSLFCLIYIISEIGEVRALGCGKYFEDLWNYFDLVNYLSLIASHAVSYYLQYQETALLASSTDYTEYISFQEYIGRYNQAKSLSSFVTVICTFKVFKYLQVSPQLSALIETLKQAAPTLGYFFVVIFVQTFGFAIAFFATFNTYSFEFRTVSVSFKTLLFALIGKTPEFEPLNKGNRLMAPLLFFVYMFFVAVVAFSFILTIISEEFVVVKETLKKKAEDKDMDMLASRFSHTKGKVKLGVVHLLALGNEKWKHALMKKFGMRIRPIKKRKKLWSESMQRTFTPEKYRLIKMNMWRRLNAAVTDGAFSDGGRDVNASRKNTVMKNLSSAKRVGTVPESGIERKRQDKKTAGEKYRVPARNLVPLLSVPQQGKENEISSEEEFIALETGRSDFSFV